MPDVETPQKVTPVAFCSHGSPWMCCKDSESSRWWTEVSMPEAGENVKVAKLDTQLGRNALTDNIKGVVFIGAHWEVLDNGIRIATKLNPNKAQMDMVDPKYWKNYPVNVSVDLAERVISLLKEYHFKDVKADSTFDWHDDTITPAKWMFPEGTPPATVVSLNARFNPVFHVRIGRALSELRKEGIMIVGTGGAVHNLYRNNWLPMLAKGDNFQPGKIHADWAVDFERTVTDVISSNSGPSLAGSLVRLTQSPKYKDAHPTDDHYMPLLVAAGAAMEEKEPGRRMAQTWELQNMCNDQFMWGRWSDAEATVDA